MYLKNHIIIEITLSVSIGFIKTVVNFMDDIKEIHKTCIMHRLKRKKICWHFNGISHGTWSWDHFLFLCQMLKESHFLSSLNNICQRSPEAGHFKKTRFTANASNPEFLFFFREEIWLLLLILAAAWAILGSSFWIE